MNDSYGNCEPNTSKLIQQIDEQRKIIEQQQFVLDVVKAWANSSQRASTGYTKARMAVQALIKGML